MKRVAVIGAGMAGAQVARRLMEAGFSVRVFDKARGAGGRMSTRRSDAGPFDHGTPFFTAEDPRFRRRVAAWRETFVAAPWEGRIVRIEGGLVQEEETPTERFVGVPKMNAVVRDLLGEIPTEFGVRIERLVRVGEGWSLRCDAGFHYDGFEMVVVAVPPAQALSLLEGVPALAAQVGGMRMWPCHALMLAFESPLEVDFDGAFLDGDIVEWAMREDSKPGRDDSPRWVVHSRADWSEFQVETPVEEVGARVEDAFAASIGVALPPIRWRATHRWLYARPVQPVGSEPLFDAHSGIGVCGDWLRGDRVEDAFLSAEELVDAILKSARGI